MKYKNIRSAIHNLGHSFISLMNYVDDGYVIDDLVRIRCEHCNIEIDWINGTFEPAKFVTSRITKSIKLSMDYIEKHFSSQNVEYSKFKRLMFIWTANNSKYMIAECDRGKEYKIDLN